MLKNMRVVLVVLRDLLKIIFLEKTVVVMSTITVKYLFEMDISLFKKEIRGRCLT